MEQVVRVPAFVVLDAARPGIGPLQGISLVKHLFGKYPVAEGLGTYVRKCMTGRRLDVVPSRCAIMCAP